MRRIVRLGMLIGLQMGVWACDQDPFGVTERRVAGDYRLNRWEDGTTYYLVGPGPAESGGGAIEGTVQRIGWSDSLIVVRRRAMAGQDGWMIVEVGRGRVRGPLSDAEFQGHSVYARISTYRADSAWRHLE